MLRVSKIKSTTEIQQDKLSYYPFDLKIGSKVFHLDKRWYELDFRHPQRLVMNHNLAFPKPLSNNLFSFLHLPKQYQHRCLHFSKYLLNSNIYEKRIYHQIGQDFTPFQIIQFYQIQNHCFLDTNHQIQKKSIPVFVHAGITLGNGLCLSKIGYLGLYITDIKDIIQFYETDENYIKLCSSSFHLSTRDEFFKRNIQIPNTIDEEEQY